MAQADFILNYLKQKQIQSLDLSSISQNAIQTWQAEDFQPGRVSELPFQLFYELSYLTGESVPIIWATLLQAEAFTYLDSKINYHNRINDLQMQQTIADLAKQLKARLAIHQQTNLLASLYPWAYQETELGHYHNLREKLEALYVAAQLEEPTIYEDTFNINKNEYVNLFILLLLELLKD